MRFPWIPVLATAVLVSGCASVSSPEPVATATAAAPAPVAGYDWHYTPEDGVARLPNLAKDETRLLDKFLQILHQPATFLLRQSLDIAGPTPYVEGSATTERVLAG